MPRRGEKRKRADCTSVRAQDGQRRSPRLTSSSHGECSKQPNYNAAGATCSDDDLGPGSQIGPMSECIEGNGVPCHCKDTKHNESWLPEKRILEIILDTLQRKDTYDIFAEPVDPSEVEEYYEIITEPMDFGTMRAKLHEGLYKNIQQFERDVYLIFENAMYFNSSGTVYFRQARALGELAKKVFDTLKTDPENFEREFNATRRRSSRNFEGDPRGSTLRSGQKLARDFGSSSMTTDVDQKGVRKQRRAHMPDIDRRCTYNPWKFDLDETDSSIISLNLGTKTLIPVNENIGYRKSLLSFVKDLGPTAQRVAEHKLQGLRTPTTTNLDASPQIPSSSSHLQPDLNKSFSPPMSHTNSPHKLEKTDVITTRQTLDKGKSVKTFSPDASTSAKSRKGEPDLKDEGDVHNRNGVVVMGLIANRDRTHRNPPKESKNSQVGRFDLNQAQPIPTSSHLGSVSTDDSSISRPTPFGSLATAQHYNILNLEQLQRDTLYNQLHYVPPLYSSQFWFNVPLFDPWLNGRTRMPRAMQPCFDIGWSRSSQMSLGQVSNSHGYTGRNEFIDINQVPFANQTNRLLNFEQ